MWTGTHEDGDTIRVESINTNIQHGRSISKDTDSSDGLDKGLVTEYGRDLSEFRINLDEDTTGVEPTGGNWIQHDRLASKDMDLPGKTGDSSRPTKKVCSHGPNYVSVLMVRKDEDTISRRWRCSPC